MSWLISAIYAAAGGFLVAGIVGRRDALVRRRLAGGITIRGPSGGDWLDRIGRRIPLPETRGRLERSLESAAVGAAAADRLMGAKALLFATGGVVGLAAWPAVGAAAVVPALAAGSTAFVLPDILLARRAVSLRRRAAEEMPSLLDLVAVCVTAGLSPRVALERAADALRGPLRESLQRAKTDVSLGGSWRTALRETADRLDLRDLRRLALALERGQRLGAPLAEQLRRLAREVRAERRTLAEERARRAPVLMLFPLVFLILPAFILAAVIPAILVATRGIP